MTDALAAPGSWKSKFLAVQARAKKYRERSGKVIKRGGMVALGAAVVAGASTLDEYMGDTSTGDAIPVAKVFKAPVNLAVGGVLVAAELFGEAEGEDWTDWASAMGRPLLHVGEYAGIRNLIHRHRAGQ